MAGREGLGRGAHGEVAEQLGVPGDGLLTTESRRRSPWPEEEEGGGDDAPGIFCLPGTTERTRAARRGSGARRRGEAVAVATATMRKL